MNGLARRLLRSAAPLVVVLALAGASGCGVPTESQARAIATDEQLTDAATPTTPPGPTARSVVLYFLDGERLARVERPVEQVPDLTVAVNQLLSGATDAERKDGLLSAIPPDTTALGTSLEAGTLTLNLSEQFTPVGDTYLKACAQIVYTVTAIKGIDSVRFLVEGDLINPPTVDDGNLPKVGRVHYRTLAP